MILCFLDEFFAAASACDLYASLAAGDSELLFAARAFKDLVFGVIYGALVAVAPRSVAVSSVILTAEQLAEECFYLAFYTQVFVVLVTSFINVFRENPEIRQDHKGQTDKKQDIPRKYGAEDHEDQRQIQHKSPKIVKPVSPVHKSGETIPESHLNQLRSVPKALINSIKHKTVNRHSAKNRI